jgi:hypothetical protein
MRALPLLYALKSGAEQTASMILVAADHVKDIDGNSKIQAANSPPNNTPKAEWIRTAPLLEVDGNRCMLAHVRVCACVFWTFSSSPPFLVPANSRSLACASERVVKVRVYVMPSNRLAFLLRRCATVLPFASSPFLACAPSLLYALKSGAEQATSIFFVAAVTVTHKCARVPIRTCKTYLHSLHSLTYTLSLSLSVSLSLTCFL